MSIKATEFKAKCLRLIDDVAAKQRPLVITKRGKPVARIVPFEDETPLPGLFGYMKGTGEVAGDIIEVSPEAWSAESGDEDDLYAGGLSKDRVP
ncbi:MAG: type II toxin-antitoxin system Phd/YefM family antitoxin [Steroidobacteraceae bacterium]